MTAMRILVRGVLALVFSAALLACDQEPDNTVIYLVRHAEKLTTAGDPGLNNQGRARAGRLAELMAEQNIQAIYSTDYRRTLETAEPVARKLGLQVRLYNPSHLAAFAERIADSHQRILVIGHSNTTPGLAELLGAESGQHMEESEYGRIYRIERQGGEVRVEIESY